VANPIEQFVIKNKVDLSLGGVDISFTNSAMWMVIGMVVSVVFIMMASSKKSMVPNRLQMVGEMLYMFILAVTGALALLIFMMVIVFGLFNHGLKFFSLFAPAGVPWFIYPVLVPIEIVSFFVRPLTLSVRLFANMMAGHIILKVVASFAVTAAGVGAGYALFGIFPVMINVGMIAFETLVAVIQAYVFAILTCVYLKDTVELHH